MSLQDAFAEAEELDTGKEKVLAFADVARRALDLGDLALFARAKSRETREARFASMHRHSVVACAEMVDQMPRILAPPDVEEKVVRALVWGLKYGAGSAMDLPEIPLATVRTLVAEMGPVLTRFGRIHAAEWLAEARLAYIEGDADTLKDRVAKISPTISVRSYRNEYSDCPGCILVQVAEWLGDDSPAEEIETVLAPAFSGRPFPRDVPLQKFFAREGGGDPICENGKSYSLTLLARAYARSARVAEARAKAAAAIAGSVGRSADVVLGAHVVALQAELAANHSERLAALASDVEGMRVGIEDPYQELDAVLTVHRARVRLGDEAALPPLRTRALELALRLDGRLERARHERQTLERLARV
jgi:hypothetical protein